MRHPLSARARLILVYTSLFALGGAALVVSTYLLVAHALHHETITSSIPPSVQQQIIAGAKTSFLKGDEWAYTAGIVAVLLGAVLVYFKFPKLAEERRLLAAYHAEDSDETAADTALPTNKALEPA